jgi:hypothetical protein
VASVGAGGSVQSVMGDRRWCDERRVEARGVVRQQTDSNVARRWFACHLCSTEVSTNLGETSGMAGREGNVLWWTVSREGFSEWLGERQRDDLLLCQTGGARISGLCCPPVAPSGLGVVPVSADPPAAEAVARPLATR